MEPKILEHSQKYCFILRMGLENNRHQKIIRTVVLSGFHYKRTSNPAGKHRIFLNSVWSVIFEENRLWRKTFTDRKITVFQKHGFLDFIEVAVNLSTVYRTRVCSTFCIIYNFVILTSTECYRGVRLSSHLWATGATRRTACLQSSLWVI